MPKTIHKETDRRTKQQWDTKLVKAYHMVKASTLKYAYLYFHAPYVMRERRGLNT